MRIKSRQVAEMLGVTPKTVSTLAAKGELPSAAQIGKLWTFDRSAIEAFLADQEERTRQAAWARKISFVGAKSGGFVPPCEERKSEKAFARGISRLLGNSATGGSKNSRPPRGTGKRM